jgi:hypothetical protein
MVWAGQAGWVVWLGQRLDREAFRPVLCSGPPTCEAKSLGPESGMELFTHFFVFEFCYRFNIPENEPSFENL